MPFASKFVVLVRYPACDSEWPLALANPSRVWLEALPLSSLVDTAA